MKLERQNYSELRTWKSYAAKPSKKEQVMALILDDVKDAFPSEIMGWFLSFEDKAPREYIFDCEGKTLIELEGLSHAEVTGIELRATNPIRFSLKANTCVLNEYREKLEELNPHVYGKKDVEAHFWAPDIDDIFHDYQEELEEALEEAFEPFFKESFPLWDSYHAAKKSYQTLQSYFDHPSVSRIPKL